MNTGIIASYREKFLLLKEKCLSDEEFVLYEYCIHCADFDENHKGKYGTFSLTNKELGSGIGWSEDKIGRHINILLFMGLIRKTGRNRIEILDYSRFSLKNAFNRIKGREETAYLQAVIAEIKPKIAKMRTKNANLRSKGVNLDTKGDAISDISSSKVNPITTRTFEDYQKIKNENGYTMLTEEDMRWIDINVTKEDAIQAQL